MALDAGAGGCTCSLLRLMKDDGGSTAVLHINDVGETRDTASGSHVDGGIYGSTKKDYKLKQEEWEANHGSATSRSTRHADSLQQLEKDVETHRLEILVNQVVHQIPLRIWIEVEVYQVYPWVKAAKRDRKQASWWPESQALISVRPNSPPRRTILCPRVGHW